ncbi:MAG TPA: hypothetical protein VLX67_05215 [Stellaceae bacterium]|nr:hypothetical protein [Stellaceae bacterium]
MTSEPETKTGGRRSVLVTVALVVLAYLAVAEAVLRFLPVATGLRSVAVSNAQPIFHFEPDRDFVYSRGWNLQDVVHGRVNNTGWVNEQDYTRDGKLPLIAVIGDSYIEAQMVPYAQTLQGRLAAALKGWARVYSFAASGAPLSEFAVYAAYAVREFGAAAVVINIANYDFAASDAAFDRPAGMWSYETARNGKELRLVPYSPGWLREIARHSALARYLLLNLHLDRALSAAHLIASLAPTRRALAAEPDAERRLAASAAIIPLFFRDFAQRVDLPPGRVLFVMDGAHYPQAPVTDSVRQLRQAFAAAAAAKGYETVDLEPLFLARYRDQPGPVEIPGDVHWNGAGHAVAAEGVMASRLMADLLAQPR